MLKYGNLVRTLTEDSLVMPGVPLAVMLPLGEAPRAVTLPEGDGDGDSLPVMVPNDGVTPAEKDTLPICKQDNLVLIKAHACMD